MSRGVSDGFRWFQALGTVMKTPRPQSTQEIGSITDARENGWMSWHNSETILFWTLWIGVFLIPDLSFMDCLRISGSL